MSYFPVFAISLTSVSVGEIFICLPPNFVFVRTNVQHTALIFCCEQTSNIQLEFASSRLLCSLRCYNSRFMLYCPVFDREQIAQHTARIRLFKASPQLTLLQFSLYVVQSNVRSQACMRACRLANSIVPLCSLKNAPDRILVLSRTNNLNYPRYHLEFTIKLVRLAGYQHIPGK